jgi:polar amino acid transport system substrate-binding protein
MKKLRIIIAIVLIVGVVLAFGACGQGGKKLTMATNAAFPPYEYYEGNEIVGIDAEIAALIAGKMGMELEIQDMEFGSIIAAVQTGKVDMGMAGMTVNEERLVSVDFSDTYAVGKQVIIVPESSDIASPDDLADKIIGVQESTTGDIYISDEFGDDAVQRYNKGTDAVQALLQGKVDAVVIDNEPAKAFVNANEGLKILETEYALEDYAIAVKKGNTDLLNKINKALAELSESGELQKIIDKYIVAN